MAAATAQAGSARRSRAASCDRPDPGRWGYHWPLKPFAAMHPVRGNFGDPRTLFFDTVGKGGLNGPGAFSFHDGVDISSHPRTAVYPVASGQARVIDAETVEVRTEDDRRFIYKHIRVVVGNGASVRAGKTVLGFITKRWRHVHLTEVDPISYHGHPYGGYQVVNPLAHMVPFAESTPPVVRAVSARDMEGHPVALDDLHGIVQLLVNTFDYPAVPVFGVWHDKPVSPALIEWSLTKADGRRALAPRVAVDFRRTIPPDRRFWVVYARGTFQNFPVIGSRFFFGRAGRLVYRLERDLYTRLFPNGSYVVHVRVSDICGNERTRAVRLRIDNAARSPLTRNRR